MMKKTKDLQRRWRWKEEGDEEEEEEEEEVISRKVAFRNGQKGTNLFLLPSPSYLATYRGDFNWILEGWEAFFLLCHYGAEPLYV